MTRRTRPSRISRHRMPVFRPTAFVLVPAAGVGLAIILYLLWGTGKKPDSGPAPKDSVAVADTGRPRGPRAPSDWFHAQRAYPYNDVDPADLARARTEARAMRSAVAGGAVWDPVGPTNIGGRIPDLAV